MINKILIVFCCLFVTSAYSQEHKDSLFYKSGMIKVVKVLALEKNAIQYEIINQKNKLVRSSVKLSSLKSYRLYSDTINSENIKEENSNIAEHEKPDSFELSPGLISINPFSPFLLGFNTDFTYRFGEKKLVGIHIPFRLSTFLNSFFYGQFGIGLAYFSQTNDRLAFRVAVTPNYFMFDGESGYSLIGSFGGVRYFNSNWALTGYFGLGPATTDAKIMIDGHIGLAYNFGKSTTIFNKK